MASLDGKEVDRWLGRNKAGGEVGWEGGKLRGK